MRRVKIGLREWRRIAGRRRLDKRRLVAIAAFETALAANLRTTKKLAIGFQKTENQMANKEQKGNANSKKVAKLSLKEKRLKKQEKKKH